MLNQLFNGFDSMLILAVLATEGIKCFTNLFNIHIRGKLALLLFCLVMFSSSLALRGQPDNTTYCILILVRFFSAIGIYSFISRLYDALKYHPVKKR